jgi:SET and MYND domain-containing protein
MIRRSAARIADLAQQLEARSSSVMLVNLPNSGRSLIAANDIEAGTVIHADEQPMLCTPSPAALDSTCASCLRPLMPLSFPASAIVGENKKSHKDHRFCSEACENSALDTWLQIYSICDFASLRKACKEKAEKFPLMVARLACLDLQQQQQQEKSINSLENSQSSIETSMMRGDALKDLSSLCYANIPKAPADWTTMHALLLQGLDASGQLSTSKFDLDWYTWVLSRLHLNVFRVDTVPPLDILGDPAALLKAASTSISGGGLPTSPQGSAVFLIGSMFNHSCAANVDVTFPKNNAEVAFVAATDIAKHTELCISYIDSSVPRAARQEQLRFAYGFLCNCPKCVEEQGNS